MEVWQDLLLTHIFVTLSVTRALRSIQTVGAQITTRRENESTLGQISTDQQSISTWNATSQPPHFTKRTEHKSVTGREQQVTTTYIGILAGMVFFIILFSALSIALATKLLCKKRRKYPKKATSYLQREAQRRTFDMRRYEQDFVDEMCPRMSCARATKMNYSPHGTVTSTKMLPPLLGQKLGMSYA